MKGYLLLVCSCLISHTTLSQDTLSKEKSLDVTRIVVKRKTENSVEFTIKTKQTSQALIDMVSSEDLNKSSIRTTSDAIKRIPGVTVFEGKFVNIRGMNERYNANYLNNAILPSTENDKKAFNYSVIPSNVVDNIVVIKSGTPDITGDFGGGIIQTNTKNIPPKLNQNVSIGVQYNTITTFKHFQSFTIQPTEWLGIIPKNKQIPQLPQPLIGNPEFNTQQSLKFNHDWSIKQILSQPSPRVSYTLSTPFKIKNKEIGVITSINYTSTNKFSYGTIIKNDLSDNRVLSSFNDSVFTQNNQLTLLNSYSIKPNKKIRLDWKNLLISNYDITTTLRKGISDSDNQLYSESYVNLVNSNKLYTTHMIGSYNSEKSTINTVLNYSYNKKQTPDYRICQYSIQENTRFLVLNDFFNSGSGRFFSSLGENLYSGAIDYTLQLDKLSSKLKTGIYNQTRSRIFSSREFVYGPIGKTIITNSKPVNDLCINNISTDKIYLIEKTNKDVDEYNGYSYLSAVYGMIENDILLFKHNDKPQNLRLIWGVRVEKFKQHLTNDYFNNLGIPISMSDMKLDILPSVNINVPITYKSNIRGSVYYTVNRPEMRELAPFSFYDFNMNSEFVGNKSLKKASIKNYDIRYEYYGKGQNTYSIGLFSKKIINPIEFSLDVTQPAIRTFQFTNSPSANVFGLELEIRKTINFLKGLVFYNNLTLVKSKIAVLNVDKSEYNRQLQGQSPYVINTSLFYEHPRNGIIVNLTYNKLGSRIAYVGTPKYIQPYGIDIYEYGRALLDVQVGKKFRNKDVFKITIGDLLSQNSILYQDLNSNNKYDNTDNTLFKYTNGVTVSINYNKSF
jgi:hypothetical protein